jgi:uncharacterized protein YfaP (DUF2135 family)
MNEELFPVEQVQMDSPRLAWTKKHGIKTHYAEHAEYPWMAIAAMDEDKDRDIAEIMAEKCCLYEEQWRVAEGDTEDDAIYELCTQIGIKLWNEEGRT